MNLSTSFVFQFTAGIERAKAVFSWLAFSSDKSEESQIRSHHLICNTSNDNLSFGCVGRSRGPREHPLGFNRAPLDDHGASFGTIGATLGHLTAALVGPQSIIKGSFILYWRSLSFLGGSQGFLGVLGWGVRGPMKTFTAPSCIYFAYVYI